MSTIQFTVNVPNNQYLAFGYGPNMDGTDMVAFLGSNPPSVLDLYAQGEFTPMMDFINNY